MGYGARSVKVLEPFQFKDGIRLAWVWYTIGDGDRRAAKVQETK